MSADALSNQLFDGFPSRNRVSDVKACSEVHGTGYIRQTRAARYTQCWLGFA